jgi:large subunit ribosomal protein L4
VTSVDVIDAKGGKAGSVDLPAEIFDTQVNVPLIHQVVVAQLAAARQGSANTKGRGEVAGGARSDRRSSPAAVSCTARRRADSTSGRRRR